jgi:hypothetical protein
MSEILEFIDRLLQEERISKETPYILVGVGSVFLAVFGLGILFAADAESFWITGWTIIPGGILVVLGIGYFYSIRNFERASLAILKSYEGQAIELNQLAEELDLHIRVLRKFLLRLRGEGKLICQINRGRMVIQAAYTIHSQPPSSSSQYPHKAESQSTFLPDPSSSKADPIVCPFCGARNKSDAIFCRQCGNSFQ